MSVIVNNVAGKQLNYRDVVEKALCFLFVNLCYIRVVCNKIFYTMEKECGSQKNEIFTI